MPESTYTISVIMPLYNVEKYLHKSMNSVLSQSQSNIEVICVDDGSTDRTLSVIRDIANNHGNVTVLTQENAGAAAARNRALLAAKGEFIAFLDPDDWYPDDRVLEDLYIAATTHDASVCGGSLVEFLDENGVLTQLDKPRNKCEFQGDGWIDYSEYQYDYFYQRFLFKTAFLRAESITFPAYRRYQDPPFFVLAMAKAGRFFALKRPTYCYRMVEKHVEWTEEKLSHLALGLRDTLDISKRFGYPDLHRTEAVRIFDLYRHWFEDILPSSSGQLIEALETLEESIDAEFANNHRKTVNCKQSLKILTHRYHLEKGDEPESLHEAIQCSEADSDSLKHDSPIVLSFIVGEYGGRLARSSIDSLLYQAYPNQRIVFLGPENKTQSFAEQYCDSEIEFLTCNENNLFETLNAYLANCTWDYFHLVRAGDLLDPRAISTLVHQCEKSQASLALYNTEFFYENWEAYDKSRVSQEAPSPIGLSERLEGPLVLADALDKDPSALASLRHFVARKADKSMSPFCQQTPWLNSHSQFLPLLLVSNNTTTVPSALYKARILSQQEKGFPWQIETIQAVSAFEALLCLTNHSAECRPNPERSSTTVPIARIHRILAQQFLSNAPKAAKPTTYPPITPAEAVTLEAVARARETSQGMSDLESRNKELTAELSRIRESRTYRLAKRISRVLGRFRKLWKR